MRNAGAGRRLYINYSIGNVSSVSRRNLASSNPPLTDMNVSLIVVVGPPFDKLLLKMHQLHFLWFYAFPIYFGRQLVLQTTGFASNLIQNLKSQTVGIDCVHRSIWRWQELCGGELSVLGERSGWLVLGYTFHVEVGLHLTII